MISILSEVAKKRPQAAYVAVSKSLQNEWSYLQRVFPTCDELSYPIRSTLMEEFIPALIKQTIDVEYELLEKPTCMGGIDIRDPIEASKHVFNTSVKAT